MVNRHAVQYEKNAPEWPESIVSNRPDWSVMNKNYLSQAPLLVNNDRNLQQLIAPSCQQWHKTMFANCISIYVQSDIKLHLARESIFVRNDIKLHQLCSPTLGPGWHETKEPGKTAKSKTHWVTTRLRRTTHYLIGNRPILAQKLYKLTR